MPQLNIYSKLAINDVQENMMPLYLNFQFKGLYEFTAAIHAIFDDTKSCLLFLQLLRPNILKTKF